MSANFQRYHVGRILVSLAVLVWVTGLVRAGGTESTRLLPHFRVVAFTLFVALSALVWGRKRQSTAFVLAHLALDAGAVSVLSANTGGIHSFFTLLYFPPIAAGAWILRREGALCAALFASAGLGAMLTFRHDLLAYDAEGAMLLYTEAMFRVFAFFLMALLTGHLGESLARAGQDLQEERRSSRLLASEHDTVLDRVRAGVLTTDPDGIITSLNPFARLLLGEVHGHPLSSVLPTNDAGESWEEARPGGQRWICTVATLPEGGRVVLVDDVTELSRMREAAASDERLVSVGRLAASMAHEIRNPLASLSGSLQLIREDHPSRLADLALGEAERLNRLVEDFLSAARRPVLLRQPADVQVVAMEVCEAFTRDPRYRAKVYARCEATESPIPASIDADRLRQALWNLLLNGAQAMPRGGEIQVRVRATGRTAERAPGVEISVADEGVGIPVSDQPKVFDPFFTTRSGGTGLGLLLVDQVARGHGGQVSLDPTVPRGTRFVVWLPEGAERGR